MERMTRYCSRDVSGGSCSNLTVMTEMTINLSAVYSTSDPHLMTTCLAAIQIHNSAEQVVHTTGCHTVITTVTESLQS